MKTTQSMPTTSQQTLYTTLITQVFEHIHPSQIHSISIGPMRFPEKMYLRIAKLYPHETLLAHPLQKRGKYFSYTQDCEITMKKFVTQQLQQRIDDALIFECNPL